MSNPGWGEMLIVSVIVIDCSCLGSDRKGKTPLLKLPSAKGFILSPMYFTIVLSDVECHESSFKEAWVPSAHKLWDTICAKKCLCVVLSVVHSAQFEALYLSYNSYSFLLSINILQCLLDIMVNNRTFRFVSPSCLKPKMKRKDYRFIQFIDLMCRGKFAAILQ